MALGEDQGPRPYRLEGADLSRRVIWGAERVLPDGSGLAFGGQDQEAEDGRPHTRVRPAGGGGWRLIDGELRAANPNQALRDRLWVLRGEVKAALAAARSRYFKGEPGPGGVLGASLAKLGSALESAAGELRSVEGGDAYAAGQVVRAKERMALALADLQAAGGLDRAGLGRLLDAQVNLELAAEALDAEPAARAIDCGPPRKAGPGMPVGNIAYDAKTGLFVVFGGDHLDYLTNDLWVFDPGVPRWEQRHPPGAPAPRANGQLLAMGDGTVRLSGGYTYSSNTDYLGGQYVDLDDGEWVYHIAEDRWERSGEAPLEWHHPQSRTYRDGPFHPDFYYGDARPDAGTFGEFLRELPANVWTVTDPPQRPRLNRDWGTARIDPDRDMMLRWSGGHSAHGGTDVPHFHFATGRWELPLPVEFPLGQLYANTRYPRGFNFNRRPWMTGHTYQNYAYDPPSRTMVKAGRPRHSYTYDPDLGDWTGRVPKPAAMCYNSCFYTLTLTATPSGAVCWDKNGKLHRYRAGEGGWLPFDTRGDALPGAYVDNSSICYDSKRDRLVIVAAPGYNTPYTGKVWTVAMATGEVREHSPAGMARAATFANIDKCCYDAANDLVLFGTYLKGGDAGVGGWTPTPAYDPAADRWVLLDLRYPIGERYGRPRPAFPHQRSDALMFDPKRELIWGVDKDGQVYVLRPDKTKAGVRPL